MDERLDDYDWKEVFAIAGDPAGGENPPDVRRAPIMSDVDNTHFSRDDVAEIVWMEEGANDGPDWLIGGTLSDGRWFFIAAGCDYTGWDCQSGGTAWVGLTRDDIERFGMGDSERERLAVDLPPLGEDVEAASGTAA